MDLHELHPHFNSHKGAPCQYTNMVEPTEPGVSYDLTTSALATKLDALSIAQDTNPEHNNVPSSTNASTQTPLPRKLPDGPKESDPFQFGSRFLTPEMTGFEFNAWDHVETDDEFKKYAEKQYAFHRDHPVTEFDKSMLLEIHSYSDIANANENYPI